MHKLRLQDSTSYNCYPQLLLHLIQLRRQLLDEWIEQQPVVQRLLPDDMVDHAQCLEIMSKEITATFQKLIKSWTLLAHLCDPMHVDKYRVERAAYELCVSRGSLAPNECFFTFSPFLVF